MRPELVFPIFMGVWVTLLVGVALFYWKGSLATKRRFHPFVVAGAALIFLGFITLIMPASTFVVIVPVVALMSFLNYKITKFCGSCGATTVRVPGTKPAPCRKCGAAIG
jgi:hypothetical protein